MFWRWKSRTGKVGRPGIAAEVRSLIRRMSREVREEAGLTQRDLGALLKKPQSWVYNCETSNRRVDVTEFIAWCEACEVKPEVGLRRIMKLTPA